MKYRVASDKVIGKVLDDEAVIINLATGIYYGLDGPAAKVWDYASTGVSQEAIAQALLKQYPDQPGLETDLEQLLEQMRSGGLLVPDEMPGEEPSVICEWPSAYQPLEMTCYDDVAEMVALDPPLPELSHEMIHQPRAAKA
jgi:hypothetical protein